MIVYDVQCKNDHVFEGWFASSNAFDEQRKKKLISCPFCNSTAVGKAPMAAQIPAKANQKSDPAPVPVSNSGQSKSQESQELLAKMAKVQKELLKNSTWVGKDFDSKARAMDAGDAPHSPIHGEVDAKQAKALLEDGIGVMPLPFPVIPPEKSN